MYRHLKRGIDFVIALILAVVLSPIMAVVCVLIKIDDGGSVLFKQKRPGKKGKIFTVYKFRTMSERTHNDKGRELNDFERMTGVGRILRKTSIDELPQLFNILKGEMSFIGPRPLLTEYLDLYTPEQMRRHDVLPGISGWAQVNGRNAITWEEKFSYDVFYVDNFSFKLDLKIFIRTITNVLNQDGINSDAANTMEKFTGTKATTHN